MGQRVAKTYHRYQQGRLTPREIVNPAAVRHEAVHLHHGKEILDHSFGGDVHVAQQQPLDYPVAVPIIKLCSKNINFSTFRFSPFRTKCDNAMILSLTRARARSIIKIMLHM